MKQKGFKLSVGLATVFLTGGLFVQAESLTIGDVTGRNVTVPITMDSGENVQGYVLSVAVPAALTVTDVENVAPSTGDEAELVVSEILPEGFTLGVVMDFNAPYDGQEIPAGNNVKIAEAAMEANLVLPCGDTQDVGIAFQDGLNSPPLSNLLVIDGMSIYEDDGLVLTGGTVTVPGTCDTVRVVSTTGGAGATQVRVPVEVDNQQPVEGYVLAVRNPTDITLQEITTAGTAADGVGIEFEVSKTYPDGGTLGVVFDFDPPYDGQTLPVGDNQTLAVFVYSLPAFDCTEAASKEFDLEFADGEFGSPPLSNVLVEGGMSVAPTLVDGTVTFTCQQPAGIDYYIGATCGPPEFDPICCATGAAGGEAKVGLYYTSDVDPIQGISMAVCFPSELDVVDLAGNGQGIVQDKHLEGTITAGINAEFVSFNADNDAGELIVGILVDSTPPIPINHMYPPRAEPDYGLVLNVFFAIPEDATCDTTYDLTFCDGITGAGEVPISNRAAVFNESKPVRTNDGCLTVGGTAEFLRGDCNTDGMVDIADPAATMTYLFLSLYDPSCLDACDSNDDGMVNLADVTATLRFLFKLGPILPPPGPYVPGIDPTEDAYGVDLGCESGNPCD